MPRYQTSTGYPGRTEVRVAGLRELGIALKELPKRVAARMLAFPVLQAAQIVRDEARAIAPVYHGDVADGHPPPGTLKKSIIVKRVYIGPDAAQYIVAVRHGKRYQSVGKKHRNLDAFYWTWVEFGSIHNQRHSFLRPAFESKKNTALNVITIGLANGIEQIAKEVSWGTPR